MKTILDNHIRLHKQSWIIILGSTLIQFICKLKPPKTHCFRGFGVPGAIRTRGVPLRST